MLEKEERRRVHKNLDENDEFDENDEKNNFDENYKNSLLEVTQKERAHEP